ncbi:MAG: hypothetical protein HY721_04305, partial [Planctomycetes bacterium]|nr:hypothetical protein [Planctomycetota bacterium]
MKTAARPAQHLVLLVSLSWQGCTGASEEAGEKPQIRPRLEECSLEAAGRALKPAGPRLRAGQADGGGELWLSVQGDSVTALSRTRGEPLWTARSADGSQLAWLGSGGGVLYLVGYRTDPQAGQQVQVSPHRVARLDLKSGKWLESLVLGTEGGTQPPERTVLEVLAGEEDEEHVLVLSSLARPAPDQREPSVSAYEVACFRAGEVRPLWSRTFAAEGERPYTGGYLWAPRTPQYAASALQRLVRLEETVLVAPEAVQPIRCLSAATGTELWRVERPWELQRGFVGPSVWSHHIGRFGIWRHLSATDAESREAEATARASFDRMFRCAVVGGPVLVPRKGARAGTHSIFLAVSRGPREGFTGY